MSQHKNEYINFLSLENAIFSRRHIHEKVFSMIIAKVLQFLIDFLYRIHLHIHVYMNLNYRFVCRKKEKDILTDKQKFFKNQFTKKVIYLILWIQNSHTNLAISHIFFYRIYSKIINERKHNLFLLIDIFFVV